MNLNNARTFYYVAKYRSFTKVATLIGHTQGAISTRIKNLEKELHTTLMHRTNSDVILTPDGEKLYVILEKTLFDLNNFELEISHIESSAPPSPLKIGISNKASKSHYYHKPCADLYIRSGAPLIVHDTLENLFSMLRNHELDAIFTARYQVPEFEKFKIGQFTLVLCANINFDFNVDYEFIFPNYFFLTGASPTSTELFPDGDDEKFQKSEIIQKTKVLFSIHPQNEGSPFLDDLIYLELIRKKENILTLLPDFLISEALQKQEVKILHVVDFFPIFCYHNIDIHWQQEEKLVALRSI